MRLIVPALLLANLLTIALPFVAIYLWKEWNNHIGTVSDAYANRCLYGAIAVTLFILLGRYIIAPLLSKKRKGEDEPEMCETKRRETIRRPDGSKINVEYYGKENGQPIILVHGLSSSIRNWYYQRKYFEKDYRLIMMDLAGMGKSTRPANKDYSLEKLAGDLHAVIEHSGSKNPILWGHSLGGMTILSFLANNTTVQIKGVILENTTYTNPLHTIIFRRLLTSAQKSIITPLSYSLIVLSPFVWLFRWMNYMNGGAHMMTRFFMFAGTQTWRQLDFVTRISTLTPTAVMARGCLGMFSYDVTNELAGMNLPILIITATRDRLTQPDASRYMKSRLPNAELVTMASANHQTLIERHDDVNAAAEKFISNLH